ncbi:hypothetical protein SAMN05421774_102626 [Gemmobacter megaterium]|uniref:DUF2155 domain-containing protein n=1 Tax=Gemmobacter megaterium TaxID=1086013 RepID=A0A1N7MEF8_9RHOB|nr:DUF2155 domain-containing protein [Gemmobacter megaterium]GGE07251.1 hypothetical protein GCM10011345_11110 [Gemmobacter megaterium]SIS84410.1 hypothetical protein SAMN05421774_102626 [Gemmobacter megaterium]
MIRLSVLLVCLAVGAAQAQSMREAPGAELRWLDKASGETADVELSRGQSAAWGRLTIQLDGCRYPEDNPAGEAYAHLTIRDSLAPDPVYSGWMVASSPALSALDHARYDVWVLRCLMR